MATLRIDLRSGFDRDTAEIWIDQDLRWREDAVTTKFTLQIAASVPLEVPDGSADVRIVLPGPPDRGDAVFCRYSFEVPYCSQDVHAARRTTDHREYR